MDKIRSKTWKDGKTRSYSFKITVTGNCLFMQLKVKLQTSKKNNFKERLKIQIYLKMLLLTKKTNQINSQKMDSIFDLWIK